VPYIFGEFAAGGSHVDMKERVKYAQYMKQKFAQYNTTGLWWMGLLDRKTLVWTEADIVGALLGQ
jgi:endoglucanase